MSRLVLIVVAAVVLLGGGVTGVWYVGARSAKSSFADWAETLRADGYEVRLGAVTVSGFPRTTEATVEGLEIARPQDSYAWRWSAQRLRVTGRPDGDSVSVRVQGAQQLDYVVDGEERSARFGAQRFRIGILRDDSGRIEQVTAELGEFVMRAHDDEDALTARQVQADLTRAPGAGAIPGGSKLQLGIDGLIAPGKRTSPLGSDIEALNAEVTLQHGLASLDLGKEIPALQAAEATFTVAEARLLWGLLNLHANGTVALDEQYRLHGRFETRLQNFVPALDALYAAKRIDGALRADYYAALLPHVQGPESQNFNAVLELEDGNIRLVAAAQELGTLTLGPLAPILNLPR